MADGIYSALSGAKAQSAALDVVANNLANAPTSGFKGQRLAFRETLAAAVGESSVQRLVVADGTYTDFSAGKIQGTGNALDVAIDGDGFFVVQVSGAERYTRAGSFTVGAEGQLLTTDGNTVLGSSGSIVIPQGAHAEIKSSGAVVSGNRELGKIQVVDFEDKSELVREGGVWRDPGTAGKKDTETSLHVGAIELSNVNVVAAMTELIRVSRAYEAFNRAIENFRAMDKRITNELGG